MRVILLICSVLISIFGSFARGVEFSEKVWDFGTIAEEGGEVSHKFIIKNNGIAPFVVTDVSTSCGCTSAAYSKRPLKSGEEMELEVKFDPMFRPNHFSKSVRVYTSSSSAPEVLTIKGVVTPRVLPIVERYPYTLSDKMRIGGLYVAFRAVPHRSLVQQSLEFRSLSDRAQDIEFRLRRKDSPLQLFYDRRVEPNEGATLELGYFIDGGRGFLADTIDIYIDGRAVGKSLYVKGTIVE